MSTPEDRAELINSFMLTCEEGLRDAADVSKQTGIDLNGITFALLVKTRMVTAVLEELREAKLARARLEMKAS